MVTFFGNSARGADRFSQRFEENDDLFLFDRVLNDNGDPADADNDGGAGIDGDIVEKIANIKERLGINGDDDGDNVVTDEDIDIEIAGNGAGIDGDIAEKIANIKAAVGGDGDISEKIADIKAALGIDDAGGGNGGDDDCDDGGDGNGGGARQGGTAGARNANDMQILGVAGAGNTNNMQILGVAGGAIPVRPINNVFGALPAAAIAAPSPGLTTAVAPPIVSANGSADLAGLGINGKLQINHPDGQAIADAFAKLAQSSPTFLQALKYAVETQNAGVLTIDNDGLSEGALGSAEIDGNSLRLGDVVGGKVASSGVAFPNDSELYSTIAHELGHIIQNQHPNIYGAKYNSTVTGGGNAAQGNEHFSGADGNTGIDFNAEAYMADINREITAKGVTPLALSPEGT